MLALTLYEWYDVSSVRTCAEYVHLWVAKKKDLKLKSEVRFSGQLSLIKKTYSVNELFSLVRT